MKFFAIFATVLAMAMAIPNSSVWTLQDLSEALQNPNTNPAFIPYLEQALNKLMESLMAGHNVNAIIVHLPENIDLVPSPVNPEIVDPAPQPPISSPLVQIIVNVNDRKEVAPSPVNPDINPGPVIIDEPEEIIPGPAIVDEPEEIIIPAPVIVNKPEFIN
ncbi:hypothetical protein KGM_214309 [Danaus plexippus plexippus]|uniref:Uncharacterized protein n=1 Tax=Danaus plexippus plexippus TaxID=278856 RepID=A0A212EH03_DANPL|nr:hypothetical protein KGM_214309 [Danaus plexippus plexippus]